MSHDLVARLALAEFWNEYLFVDERAAQEWEPWQLTVSIPAGPPLQLSAADGYISLALMLGSGPKEVAWDDLAHWHPHLLRWSELLGIVHRFASAVPAIQPDAVLLLLARFAPVTSGEDAQVAFPAI